VVRRCRWEAKAKARDRTFKEWDMWEMVFDKEPKKRMEYFLDKHGELAGELERMLEDLQSYPKVKWLRLYGNKAAVRFATDSEQQIRLAGKAYFHEKILVITHFSYHP
jgi:hypothetical protein